MRWLPGRAGLYWRTLRWLRPVQFYRRLWFRLVWPRPDLSEAPAPRPHSGRWVAPARRLPSLTGSGEFFLLGVGGHLDQVGWEGPEREKLWRYNQHYFDDLNAMSGAERSTWHRALIDRWLQAHPPARGVGWEPYPTSLRIVNWVKWALAGNELGNAAMHSLAIQTRWLMRRLEWHLLGNHLFANAKALVFAGLFFKGQEARRWLQQGLSIIDRELPEQVLPDGGHFERSTLYHALALEDLLDLCNVAAAFEGIEPQWLEARVSQWHASAQRMLGWLLGMCHPDGEIAFFNDSALDVAPSPSELQEYARRLGIEDSQEPGGGRWFDASGYVRLASDCAKAFVDLAQVGPDYLPGHAHADTLSVELSVGAHRLLVNSGTSSYAKDEERLRQRGTAAHNTVIVDGVDSSEVWSGFR
ncbi:MAG: alginate lyase family protein, partial [Gammaproteobacteria bacterium]|nr:alginate lyase family protein [Gammaproteobacteria bacterium]